MSMENMPLLEFADRFPVKEYRISDDKIEARIVAGGRDQDSDWRAVSSEQLSSHVKNNTAVARWLERNLGWRRLLRACRYAHSRMRINLLPLLLSCRRRLRARKKNTGRAVTIRKLLRDRIHRHTRFLPISLLILPTFRRRSPAILRVNSTAHRWSRRRTRLTTHSILSSLIPARCRVCALMNCRVCCAPRSLRIPCRGRSPMDRVSRPLPIERGPATWSAMAPQARQNLPRREDRDPSPGRRQ